MKLLLLILGLALPILAPAAPTATPTKTKTPVPFVGPALAYAPVLEAENATVSVSGWTQQFNSNSPWSGSASNNGFAYTKGSGTLSFSFSPAYSGRYKILAHVIAPNSSSCELTVGISGTNDMNGNSSVSWLLPRSGNAADVYVFNSTNASGTSFATAGGSQATGDYWTLAAGNTYTINFSGVSGQTNKLSVDYIQLYFDSSQLPSPTVGAGTGLCASYWNWTGGSPPTVPGSAATWSGLQGPINFNWSGGPEPGIGATQFVTQWSGKVRAEYTAPYTFNTQSDDGVVLIVNGVKIINDWNDHPSTPDSGTINLTAGTQYSITLQYYQNGGGAVMSLNWSVPCVAQVAVPMSALYSACSGTTPTRTPTPAGTPTRTPSPTPVIGPPPPPSITSISPTSGSVDGGMVVTVWGANLTSSTSFTVCGSAATGVTFINSGQMTLVVPAKSTAGVCDIVATNGNGSSSTGAFDQYTYLDNVYQGLTPTARLYGLEYIPFPVQSSGGNNFYDLGVSFNKANQANNAVPKNTARWKILLRGLADTAGSPVQIETRIGPFGVSCTTGYIDNNTQGNNFNLDLPPRPQDLSTTYVWLTSSAMTAAVVPPTERIDAVGDPRYVPYLDMMSGSSNAFADNYNWFFRNLNSDASGAVYRNFATDTNFSHYAGGNNVNVDVPKLYRLVREGVMSTTSVYTAISGWSNYYWGMGGEIGGDSSNDLPNAVQCYAGPWNGSGTIGVDEIIGSGSTPGASWVRNTAAAGGWKSMPYIGELWPDALYQSDWSASSTNTAWGNLRNTQNGGVSYRDSVGNFDFTNFPFDVTLHRNGPVGCATFFDGTDGSSSNPFNHSGQDNPPVNAPVLNDGVVMGNDFNFAMPTTFNVTRPWALNQGGNTPDEWNSAPYNNIRTKLEIYSACTYTATSSYGFYDWNKGESRSSATIRAFDTSGNVSPLGVPSAGFFVVNGLAPSTNSGYNFVARFAMLACIRTFLDAGAPTTTANQRNRIGTTGPVFRIPPVPRVEFTSPLNGQDLSHNPTITLKWQERYARWDNMRYTENYPCVDGPQGSPCGLLSSQGGNPALEWHDSTNLAFNLKYTEDQRTWYSVRTNAVATIGVYDSNVAESVAYSPTHLYSCDWAVGTLSASKKTVRVECYRLDPNGNPLQHYSYHDIQLTTAP